LTQHFEEVHDVDIRIGILNVARELSLEVADDDADTVKAEVEAAISGDASVLWLTDTDGRRVGVPIATLGYVEFGSTSSRTIGFGS
jgi:hypothetical protein